MTLNGMRKDSNRFAITILSRSRILSNNHKVLIVNILHEPCFSRFSHNIGER